VPMRTIETHAVKLAAGVLCNTAVTYTHVWLTAIHTA